VNAASGLVVPAVIETKLLGRIVNRGIRVITGELLGNLAATLVGYVLHVEVVGGIEEVGQQVVFRILAGAGHNPFATFSLGSLNEFVVIVDVFTVGVNP